MRSTKTKLDTIYLWVNLKRKCFYLNYLKRLLPIVLFFLINTFSGFSQKNEFRLSYFTPHVEKIEDLSFFNPVILKNHNMNLLYYRDVYKITDNTKLSLLLGFEYAWFKQIATFNNDTISYDLESKTSDNFGLRAGIKYDFKVYNRKNFSVHFDASYSILARLPIISYDLSGIILNDTMIYAFAYTIDDTGSSLINHAIDLSLIYKRKINSESTINFGINFLMYLNHYRSIEYYTTTSIQQLQPPINPNSVSYFYKQIGFSVGVTF